MERVVPSEHGYFRAPPNINDAALSAPNENPAIGTSSNMAAICKPTARNIVCERHK